MSKEKRKGDAFERAVAAAFRLHGHPRAERTLRLGAHDDRGDIEGLSTPRLFLVDCKDRARHELGVWLEEVAGEARAGEIPRVPVVVVKRRGKTAERAFVVMELADFAEVIR